MKVNQSLNLGPGNVSTEEELGCYYQDFTPAKFHYDHDYLGKFDENGIPYLVEKNREYYNPVYVIQYALLLHDLILLEKDGGDKVRLKACLEWLLDKAEPFEEALVLRNELNEQYKLSKGWISAMYQGQAISIFLRGYQMFGEQTYLDAADKFFRFFRFDYSEGGVMRTDDSGYIWLEEYPTDPPSYVLNGFIYSVFGVLDHYRVTKSADSRKLYEECLRTIEDNIHKYDLWYWSVYDQGKKRLVSRYYQKNVHIPLMKILFLLTGNSIFDTLAKKWERQLNSFLSRAMCTVMYRIQPRLRQLQLKL